MSAESPVADLILTIRGQRVILDSDLARLYGVTAYRLNEQVKRNTERFPEDFAFRLTSAELALLRSQIAILNDRFESDPRSQTATSDAKSLVRPKAATSETGRGRHRKYLPWVFTEHGAIMAANVLNSPQAVRMSVHVVRAFVALRQSAVLYQELAKRVEALENGHHRHDAALQALIDTVRHLIEQPKPDRKPIGFRK